MAAEIPLYFDGIDLELEHYGDLVPIEEGTVPEELDGVAELHVFASEGEARAFADAAEADLLEGEEDYFRIHEAEPVPGAHCVLIIDRRDPNASPAIRRIDHRVEACPRP
jgi:hypothetical protein